MERLKCDKIKLLITLPCDYIKRLSLYYNKIFYKVKTRGYFKPFEICWTSFESDPFALSMHKRVCIYCN